MFELSGQDDKCKIEPAIDSDLRHGVGVWSSWSECLFWRVDGLKWRSVGKVESWRGNLNQRGRAACSGS